MNEIAPPTDKQDNKPHKRDDPEYMPKGVQIGPVVSADQLAYNLACIDIGRAGGAELLCGGTRVERDTEG